MTNMRWSSGDASMPGSRKGPLGSPLRAEFRGFVAATPEAVFESVAGFDKACRFVPTLQHVERVETALGAVRRCDFGNGMIIDEYMVQYEYGSSYAYSVAEPNPFGLWRHLAVVSCEADGVGTTLRWRHYFDHDDLPAMLERLNSVFDGLFARLFDEYGGERLHADDGTAENSWPDASGDQNLFHSIAR